MIKAFGFSLLLSSSVLLAQQQFNIATIAGGAPPPTPAAATSVAFGQPLRVAVDKAGNAYFSSYNCVFKIDGSGTLTRVAGNARAGYSGDSGPAISAQLNQPQGLAFDSAGDLLIADTGNHVVRIVTPDGLINTFAGNGTAGYSGDGGAANDPHNAQLSRPTGLAVDSTGNVYIADAANFVVRQVAPSGVIISFAGNSIPGFAGDGGAAAGAQISGALDVAVDSSDNLYIADTDNNSIRKVDSSGNITTVAGNQTAGYSGDGGAATSAELNHPVGVTTDSQGNLYIAEYSSDLIRKVDTKGNISTYAGNGAFGFAGDGGAASSASFANPMGIAMDSGGNLYVVDLWNYRVRKISSSGTVSTLAGSGTFSYSGDNGPATNAQLNLPGGVAVDAARNVYVSDSANHRVRKISRDGSIATVAGTGAAGFGGDGGQAAAAQLNSPLGLALDAAGNLYIADTLNSRVRKVATDGTISTVAGNGSFGFSGDNGAATSAQLNQPEGVAVDKAGNLYIADTGNHRVRMVSGGTISTIAGTGVPGYIADGDAATGEELYYPNGVAVDSAGNIYIADTQNNRVRVVSSDGVIRLIAGNGYAGYYGDGTKAVQAAVVAPASVVVDASFNVYIASENGGSVRVVGRDGNITTIAGSTAVGYSGDGGPAAQALLNGAQAIGMDAAGNIYVADTNNNAVRMLTPLPAPQQ
jgi:sugar lactone lactonase YvrE